VWQEKAAGTWGAPAWLPEHRAKRAAAKAAALPCALPEVPTTDHDHRLSRSRSRIACRVGLQTKERIRNQASGTTAPPGEQQSQP
jgi:hypothetical protein